MKAYLKKLGVTMQKSFLIVTRSWLAVLVSSNPC